MNDKNVLLRVENIHTYLGASHILKDVSLRLGHGETLLIMGRNGMGKTTLLRSIIGLSPPKRGKIFYRGSEITGLATEIIAKKGLALIPEDRGIFPNLSVYENLIMSSRPSPTGRRDWDLEGIYELFPILIMRQRNLGNQLSGGEQRMLSIARVLLTHPDLILIDEATEALAPILRKEVALVLKKIKDSGVALVIVDKYINEWMELADNNIILSKGEIVFQGNQDKLLKSPLSLQSHLGL
ncbi:MAG: ABC transporter ATP-binding protein [Deltaproteobacteria bacterium]|nr:ABC transporter ATP-binding protein [Deltaproteobacteria bacterium]